MASHQSLRLLKDACYSKPFKGPGKQAFLAVPPEDLQVGLLKKIYIDHNLWISFFLKKKY